MKKRSFFARLALTALLAAPIFGCGAPPAPEEEDAPVAAHETALSQQDCYRGFNQCNSRCARLVQQGQDASQCYADCSEQVYLCLCRVSPLVCVQ